MSATRYNTGKPRWSLLPSEALLPALEVLEFGCEKYEPFNWQKGLSVVETCESARRHLDSFLAGENTDPESGLNTLGHLMANVVFMTWMLENRPEFDDRAKLQVNYPQK